MDFIIAMILLVIGFIVWRMSGKSRRPKHEQCRKCHRPSYTMFDGKCNECLYWEGTDISLTNGRRDSDRAPDITLFNSYSTFIGEDASEGDRGVSEGITEEVNKNHNWRVS